MRPVYSSAKPDDELPLRIIELSGSVELYAIRYGPSSWATVQLF